MKKGFPSKAGTRISPPEIGAGIKVGAFRRDLCTVPPEPQDLIHREGNVFHYYVRRIGRKEVTFKQIVAFTYLANLWTGIEAGVTGPCAQKSSRSYGWYMTVDRKYLSKPGSWIERVDVPIYIPGAVRVLLNLVTKIISGIMSSVMP